MWSHRDMKIQIPHYLGLTPMFGLDPILPAPCGPDGLPAERCLGGAGSAHATGIRRPLQPAVVVASNPATRMHKKPRTLSGTGLFVQGSPMGVESFLAL